MVDDGGDDVRHGETEAALKEENGVEDVTGLVTVDCGIVSGGIARFGREANLERGWVGIALEDTAHNEQP